MNRVTAYPEPADRFRREGFALGHCFLCYQDHTTFASLDMASRETVLTDIRYSGVFYDCSAALSDRGGTFALPHLSTTFFVRIGQRIAETTRHRAICGIAVGRYPA